MNWNFFKSNGGQDFGFHDAGVETFKGDLERYLAREIIQNSLDARSDQKKPVTVKFELLHIPASELPDLKSLTSTFKQCAEYMPQVKAAKEFFERAETLAKAKKIIALKVGDYNTVGVSGGDDDRAKGWYSLVRSSGSSAKLGGGEGGSFGIGKSAPFAASRMRVVLYSTLTEDKKAAFQGVARLVSHKLSKGKDIAQPTGYLGDKAGASIRSKKEIPAIFQRSKPGTDIFILGYESEGTWKKDLIHSVLANFWPAIHFGDLEVDIENTKINKKTLSALLDEYRDQPKFDAHLYYRAYTDGESKIFDQQLATLKKVQVRLLAGEQGLPKRVAMVRKTGMVIYHDRFQSLVPYCGVFLCRNPIGNGLLREMEPPRHDDWNPDHPEKNAHKKTASEFTSFIRECIQKLAPADQGKVLSIEGLANWLPDDDDTADESFDGEDSSKKESFQRQPEIKKITGRKIESYRRALQPDKSQPGDGDMDTDVEGHQEGPGGEGEGGGSGGDGGEEGNGGGGLVDGKAGPKESDTGKNAKPAIPIRSRVFAKNLASGVYRVIAHPLKPTTADVMLNLKAIGDDGTFSAVRIASAIMATGQSIPIPKSGLVGPVKFSGMNVITLDITLVDPRKLAMEVDAHEAD